MTPNGFYRIYPAYYVSKLIADGMRERARAFMEYYHDYVHGCIQADAFYARGWKTEKTKGGGEKIFQPISKMTAGRWISEFKQAIGNFESAHRLYEMRLKSAADTSAKNLMLPECYSNDTASGECKSVNGGSFVGVENDQMLPECDPNVTKYINNNTTNNKENLYIFFSEAKLSHNLAWTSKNKNDTETAVRSVMTKYGITSRDILIMYRLHIVDTREEQMTYNLLNFINGQEFMKYAQPKLEITLDDKSIVTGYYDRHSEILTSVEGKPYQMTEARFMKLMNKNRIKIIPELKVA